MGWTHSECETLHAGLCHFLICPSHDGDYSFQFAPSWNGGAKFGAVNQSWAELLTAFDFWATKVKDELNQPDPWGTYAVASLGLTPGHSTDNAPFTYAEAEHVEKSVKGLIGFLRDTVPRYQEVDIEFSAQFESVIAQAKSGAGRIDWKNQFVGLLINLFVTLSLAPEQAASIWSCWKQLFGNLLLR